MSSPAKSGSTTVWSLVLIATFALFAATLYAIFVVAPVEKQMGIVQKIFYFHVPSAVAMYVAIMACGLASLVDLIRPEAIEAVRGQLQRTAPTSRVRTVEELAVLLQQVGDLSSAEIAAR